MKKRILILDDDSGIRMVLSDAFQYDLPDFEVVSVENAEKALELLKTNKFDFISTDMDMGPGDSGLEFTKKARAEGVSCPIIMFCGGHGKKKTDFLNAQGTVFFEKPDYTDVIDWVKKAA